MFNLKEKSLLLSFDTIMAALSMDGSNEDPSNTVWYIDNDESILLMVHPAYGLVFYNDEMHIMGIYDREQEGEMLDLLDGWSIHNESMVWREIGIDQIDYEIV